MRPARLEVEGFTAFRQPTVVDFAGADLFALVGPTGAGKTSVIDALTFALYGTVPRLDDRRAVAPVISQNLNEARVRLDFTVDGEPYTAVRVVRATKAGATTKEARLERAGEVLAGTADELTAAVTDLLGLTFEHFTTCVSLPQGQFARFLHDKPRSRQDLLVRLLDLGLYERVASAARQRAALARQRAELVASQIEGLAGATPEARAAAAARVDELAALCDRLAAERPALENLVADADAREAQAAEVAVQIERLARLAAPAGVDELAAELAEADEARRRAAEHEDEAAAAVAEAEERLAALPARAALEATAADHRRRAERLAEAERGEAAQAAAAARLEEAVAAEEAATAARAARSAELERVRVELRARALVPELAVGEPCPVCGQEVSELPDAEHVPDLERAEQALAEAERAVAAAHRERAEAERHQVRVDEKLARVRDELAEVEARLDGGLDPDAVEEQLALVAEAEAGLAEARQAERDARRALLDAGRSHEALVEREREARRAFDAARDAVAALGAPAAERRDLAADWRALLEWAAGRRPELEAQLDEHRQAAERARTEAVTRLGELVAVCEEAGVEVPRPGAAGSGRAGGARGAGRAGAGGAGAGGVAAGGAGAGRAGAGGGSGGAVGLLAAWPGEAVAAARARAEEAVARIDAQLADAERLRADQRAATEEQQVAEALAGHLAANRFEKWLLDEAVHQLVGGASQILDGLSGGAYALAVDGRSGAFQVIDHTNASQARPARTLSGGETFLASLALALALADQVAGLATGGTARLEALFLDEGFGTLDAETLDVVAGALDELGAGGRMVGVVTHVRELADRLPVRFEVSKVGGSSSVERVEG
ncbi:MAG TPA: SMC family ATPase [Acidimicrobiales bacterium]